MYSSNVPGLEIRTDVTSASIIVSFTDEAPPFQTEEVIQHLMSDGLADRTRTLVYDIFKVPTDVGIQLKIHFFSVVEWWRVELSIRTLLENFFSSRGQLRAV